jgi:membrane protease YdiL (CAAX protease family)
MTALHQASRTSVKRQALPAFLITSFVLAWLFALPIYLDGGLSNPLTPLILVAIMTTPAIGVLAAWLVERPAGSLWRRVAIVPLRPWPRLLGFSLLGLVGGAAVVVAGVFTSAAFGQIQLDLAGFSGYQESVRALGVESLALPVSALVAIQLAAIPLNAVLSAPAALGEEVGWRGWLLPRLMPLGPWRALMVTGVVWGLWHAPLILLGYNFGRPGIDGLAMMVVGCVLLGILLGWLRLRSGSVWPPVLAHASFNAAASFSTLVAAADQDADPAAVGPLGWPTWIVMGALVLILVASGQMRNKSLTAFQSS